MALPAPIAYWPFDEGSGPTAADASGNGHTATLVAGTWDTSALKKFGAGALATASGRGASFTAMNLGTTHSVAWWMNGWDGSNDGVVLGGAAEHYGCYLDATFVYYSAGTGNYVQVVSGGGLTGAHHVVVTRTNLTITFYKDAVQVGTPATLAVGNTALTVDTISNYTSGTHAFVATVDDLRIYDVALTGPQVSELYALVPAAAGGSGPPGPPWWWLQQIGAES